MTNPLLAAGDTVLVAPGTYAEGSTIQYPDFSFSLIGSGAAVTTLQGPGTSGVIQIAFGTNNNPDYLLEGFTIRGGDNQGGGVRCVDGAFTVRDCIFEDNFSTPAGQEQGAGIYATSSSPMSLTVEGCEFRRNNCNGEGGAIYVGGAVAFMISDCVFEENTALVAGHAIHFDTASTPFPTTGTVTRCTMFNNGDPLGPCLTQGSNCGAVLAAEGSAVIDVLLTNCRIVGNQTKGVRVSAPNSTMHFVNCIIADNSSFRAAGCLVDLGGQLILDHCIVARNHSFGLVDGIEGSGVYVRNQNMTNGATATLRNSILWGNTPPFTELHSENPGDTTITAQHCNIEGSSTGFYDLDLGIPFPGNGNQDSPPRFTDPDGLDNVVGTLDDDLRLFVNSTSIDAGDNTLVPLDDADLNGDMIFTERTPLDLAEEPRFDDDPLVADSGVPDAPLYPDVTDLGPFEYVEPHSGSAGLRVRTAPIAAFDAPGSWSPATPAAADSAVFAISAGTTTSFSTPVSTDRLVFVEGNHQFDLGPHSYTATSATHESVLIGSFGLNATFFLSDGTLNAETIRAQFEAEGGSTGFTLGALAIVNADDLHIDDTFLAGNGTVNATVHNRGRVTPSSTADIYGVLSVTEYEQTAGSLLEIDIRGALTPGLDFDQLSVSGTATLGGTLRVNLRENFTPQLGDMFEILQVGTGVGEFDVVIAEGLPPGQLVDISYGGQPATGGASGSTQFGPSGITVVVMGYGGSLALDDPTGTVISDEASEAVLADLTGNGYLDAAVTLPTTNSIVILENAGGDGSLFNQQPATTVGTTPTAVIAADFDGDTHVDLAVANRDSDSVTILTNDGFGSLSVSQTIALAAGSRPVALAADAIDANGSIDIVVALGNTANGNLGSVQILPNNGSGSFAPGTEIPVGGGPAALETGLVDGDTMVDIIVAQSTSNEVTVLLNDGFATSTPPSTTVSVGANPKKLMSEDLDGDGDLDVGVATGGAAAFSILANDGFGAFTESAVPLSGAPSYIEKADLDNDGDGDIIIVNPGGGMGMRGVTIFRNDSASGQLLFSLSQAFSAGAVQIAKTGDIDGDDQDDLFFLQGINPFHGPPSSEVALYLNRPPFLRGDCNNDGSVDVSDPIRLLGVLFGLEPSDPCRKACDGNDDNSVDISDSMFMLSYVFGGGVTLPDPGPAVCGIDPTPDSIECDLYECP